MQGLTLQEVLTGCRRGAEADNELEVDGVDSAAGDAHTSPDLGEHIFPNAVWSPGIGHIMHNLTEAVDKDLPGWEPWFQKFKALNALLHHPALRKRLVATCLLGTPHEWMSHFLDTGTKKVAEWRWNSIIDSLLVILPLQPVLQTAWNPQNFAQRRSPSDAPNSLEVGGDDPIASFTGNEFKLPDVTAAVTTSSWWIYARMVASLHTVASDFTSWIEGCSCHSWLQASDDESVRAFHHLRQHLRLPASDGDGALPSGCPLAAMKSLQLARGVAKEHFSSCNANFLPQLLGFNFAGVSESDIQNAVSAYHHGRTHMLHIVSQKLHLWDHPPWNLVLLASDDVCEARQHARKILSSWDSLDHSDQVMDVAVHHRLALQTLGAGQPMRSQVEAFIAGTSLDELPQLQQMVLELRLLPTV